jgi:diguanylate cyclase (GGDEF)-like protein
VFSLAWRWPIKALLWLIFGRARFAEREEYQEFRYKLLMVLMTSGGLVTGLLVWGSLAQVNPIHASHQASMIGFTVATIILWLGLRNHPERFKFIAWTYEMVCLWENTSSLLFVSEDELRLLWFFTNVPGVFILLGRRAGWVITLGTMLGLALGNAHLERPYSPNAMATSLFCLFYLGIFFQTYVDRTFSYFSRMREYNSRLQDIASHDPLTRVLNARAYYQACETLIMQSQRSQQTFSVLFIDLDHFKTINDTHGHEAGDEVLRVVANVLGTHVRASDVLGRIGGEEFSVFLPDTASEGARVVAENLRQAVQECRPRVGETVLTITASIGVASRSPTLNTMQAIQRRADEAMYDAKRAGRNRVSYLQ